MYLFKFLKTKFYIGKAKGLQVVLYIGKDSNYNTLSESSGVRVFISNHSTIYSESEGIDISTGSETNIAVFKHVKESLGIPYSNCQSVDNVNLADNISTEYVKLFAASNLTYRSVDCYSVCYQTKVLDACGCIDLHVKFDNLKKINVPKFCNHKHNSTDSICLENLFALNSEALNNECEIKCPLECHSTSYTFSNSHSVFPTDSSYSKLKRTSAYLNSLGHMKSVAKKLVKFNVYFDEMNYQYYSELPAMTITDLFGNLGGTLGLFLGFSVLSTVEIIEFIINYCKEVQEKEISETEV